MRNKLLEERFADSITISCRTLGTLLSVSIALAVGPGAHSTRLQTSPTHLPQNRPPALKSTRLPPKSAHLSLAHRRLTVS